MTALENAKKFFEACEAAEGWAGCKQYATANASFSAQCEPIADFDRAEAYCDWMAGFGGVTAPGATYDLHTCSYDEDTNSAVFFGTYHAKHTGDGGPVPPTNKETHSEYVYILKMNADNKVEKMVKVWNPSWAMKELGWM